MKCEYCGSKTKVSSTYDLEDKVVRRRVCIKCKKSFFTEEQKVTKEYKFKLVKE